MGSWLFGNKTQDAHPQAAVSALRIQSSIQGKPLPLLWGRNRIAGNLIWYGDFVSFAVNDGATGGGKGGVFGTGASASSVKYNYTVAIEIGICQGEIIDIRTTWENKSIVSATGLGSDTTPVFSHGGSERDPPAQAGNSTDHWSLGFEVFTGTETQTPWGYLTSKHPDQALAYRGLAYVARSDIALGDTPELPNYSFEVTGAIANATATIPDANPRDVARDYLTSPLHGVPGWPAARLATMDRYATYALATGLLVSPIEAEAREASAFLSDLFKATNSSPRWSSGMLDVIPLGDSEVAGNGATYEPDTTPLYDLINDDFLPMDNGGQPIQVKRSSPSDRINAFRLEYLNRNNNYDPDVVDDKDQASITLYGEQPNDVFKAHFFCLTAAARLSAHLMLSREQIPNEYTFRLGPQFILPDVEDIVTLTRPEMSLFRQAVRIIEITEESDGALTFISEEYFGTVGAPAYGVEATAGYVTNTNLNPGNVNAPILFEPTDELAGGLAVWAAVSGVNPALWGGCNVYASYDDATYVFVDRITGPSRTGVLTAALASFPSSPTGPTIDEANTLKVDLSSSGAVLQSGTQADALGLNTASYVGGEIIAYATATLTGPNAYDLTYLIRDAYGTEAENVLHPIGTKFARLDSQILKIPFDQTRIGSTIYLKFQSFNIWGAGQQDISSLGAFTYQLLGTALASPLPPVTNVRTVFEDGFTKIWWEEVEDFRNGVRYIIRKGNTFEGGQDLGTQAHPPLVAFGAGTYWVRAVCQPLAGLIVYSETPASITIQGNLLTKNIVQTTDFQALGWPGIYSGVGKEGVDPTAFLRLVGTGSILADPDILANPDVLNSGTIASSGSYTVDPATLTLDVGYEADCSVNISWESAGIPVGANVLTDPDILNNPDILNAAGGAFIDIWIEIRTAPSSLNDMFTPSDMFGPDVPDLFNSGIVWADWQRYVPGVYRCQYMQLRAVFSTIDQATIAYLRSMLSQVSIPARIDHYLGNSVGTSPYLITFEPDDAAAPKPFNGGPLVGGTGNHPLPAISMDWPGHPGVNFVIDTLTLASVTFHFEDGTGTHIAVAGVDVYAEGY